MNDVEHRPEDKCRMMGTHNNTGLTGAVNVRWLTAFGFLLMFLSGFSADFPNENRVYDPNIHTVILHKEGFEMAMPVIALNSGETLRLTFDDLDVTLKPYRFTIRHCTAGWETTPDLPATEYIDGIGEEQIEQFRYSYNTTVEYIHYTAFFPSRFMKPRVSGNYLLIVYLETPEAPLITRRFMVTEQGAVSVRARVVQSDDPMDSYTGQRVDLTIAMPGLFISNPSREIRIVVMQNERWDNAIRDPKPRFTRGNEMDFTYDQNLVFEGGNEFRSVDIKSLRYQTGNIRQIDWDGQYHVYMMEDLSRARKPYILYQDINGRMIVRNEDYAEQSETEADYAWVHFAIPSGGLIPGGRIYLMGALADYRMAPPNEMIYDPVTKMYTCALFLKQGYYGYLYVFKQEGSSAGDLSFFEGSHWETENQYTILVYFHPLSGLFDQLVAVRDVNSRE